MQICAINTGYWDTKAYNGQKQFKFRTKMDKGQLLLSSQNTFQIEYEGESYILGDGAEGYNLDYNKTSNILHRLSTLYSLSQFTHERDEFKIVVALPLGVFKNLKSEYESYLKTSDYVKMRVNNSKKYVYIRDCKAFPEGVAALYANSPERFKDGIVGIIDFGSLTINGCILNITTQENKADKGRN